MRPSAPGGVHLVDFAAASAAAASAALSVCAAVLHFALINELPCRRCRQRRRQVVSDRQTTAAVTA